MIELNSREIAILIWVGGFLGLALLKRDVRRAAAGLLRAFFNRQIMVTLGLAVAYTTACVWLLHELGVWDFGNLKTTLVWGLTFAFVTMMDVKGLEAGSKTLAALAKDTLAATALVVFVAEFYTFPLWGELLLVPFLTVLGGMLAVAQGRPEHAIVVKPLLFLQVAAGLGILTYSAYRIIADMQEFATIDTAREFAVPIFLSLMFLPFLFALGLFMAYEQAGLRLSYVIPDLSLRRYAYWRGMLAFPANANLFRRYVRDLGNAEPTDREGIRGVIRTVKRLRRREKKPPTVAWSEGWSPYAAGEFLADQNLATNDYHCTFEDWWAESSPTEVGGDLFKDHMTYRLAGTEEAVTRLSLELNANLPGTPNESDARFWEAGRLLIARALKAATETPLPQAQGKDELVTWEANGCTITLRRDDWGINRRGGYARRLTITHPAHRETLPGSD